METLNLVCGLWLCVVMSLYMLVLFQALNPALKMFRSSGRGIHVVSLTCGCADSQLWGLTMSSWAYRYGNTLSWFLLDRSSSLSWFLGVLGAQSWLTLLLVQRLVQTEDALTRKDLSFYIAFLSGFCLYFVSEFLLLCIVICLYI